VPEKKRQHFVPRAYLAPFVDKKTPFGFEPYLFIYSRQATGPFAQAPKKTAVRSYYYSFDVDGERDQGVEDMLGRVESAAIPVMRKLNGGADPQSLSEEERGSLALLLAYMEVRVPRFRNMVETFTSEVMRDVAMLAASHPEYFERTMREASAAKGLNPPANVEDIRKWVLEGEYELSVNPIVSLRAFLEVAPQIAEMIFSYQWRVLRAPDGFTFFTSDSPVTRISTMKQPSWMGVGWQTPWMEATVPLSPDACLLISLHRPEGSEKVDRTTLCEINWRTAAHADEEVYSDRMLELSELNRPAGHVWKPATLALTQMGDFAG
jgi:hypothetical protein